MTQPLTLWYWETDLSSLNLGFPIHEVGCWYFTVIIKTKWDNITKTELLSHSNCKVFRLFSYRLQEQCLNHFCPEHLAMSRYTVGTEVCVKGDIDVFHRCLVHSRLVTHLWTALGPTLDLLRCSSQILTLCWAYTVVS